MSRDAAAADLVDPIAMATPESAISKDYIETSFRLVGSATMLPADELFADGKLLPLRKSAPFPDPEVPAPAPVQPRTEPIVKPLQAAAAADGSDPYAFSPKAPSYSSRWRELLGLTRAAAAADARSPSVAKFQVSPSPAAAKTLAAARVTNSAAARSLKLLLKRNTIGRASGNSAASDLASALLLLRDSSDSEESLSLASSRFSLSSSSSGHDHDNVPRLSLDSAAGADPNPPRIRLVRSHHRHSTSSYRTSTHAGRSTARRR